MDCTSSSTHLTFFSFSSSQTRKPHSFKFSKQAFPPHFPPKHHLSKSHSIQFPFLLSPSKHHSPSLQNPNPISIIQNQSPKLTKTHVLKAHVEKLAIFLLGSFLFFSRFNARPALALPTSPNAGFSAATEEKAETQSGKDGEDDDEELHLKVLEKNPKDVEALKVVLYGKMRKGKTKEAVKYVERLIDVEPDEVEWRLLQALSYELMGQLSKAKKLFKEILEERPLQLRALHGLALVMHKNREGVAVFEMLNKALEVAQAEKRLTEERNIKILIAQMHVVKGDLDEGLKKFQDLVNEDPRDFRPHLCQGIIYSLLDKKKEADEQFETYRSLVPHEFPQRGFLDDVIMAAKTESREQLEKDFKDEFSYKK
ncbi:protein SLOW GREEN 1, chloroplastic [Magnolia sinica]|uniref:protein SLOW GREEN 1, chloroplastic n=1 Tax=Magnolia sinica TaxID=86752 RepID=UPI0026595DFC|nr:protein SLOW GREEN 1, chloroplastic [Magnolia sinica]